MPRERGRTTIGAMSTAIAVSRPPPGLELVPEPPRRLELHAIAAASQRALDAADRALTAAAHDLPAAELAGRRRALLDERARTAAHLAEVARTADLRHMPWLSPVPVDNRMLGLPPRIRVCLFDLDGVLTDSGVLH